MQLNTLFKKIVLVFILIFLVFFLAQKINLTNADIGRHIKNGEMILNGRLNVLDTCFYSYTHSHFPTINHHWLSGMIFFIIWKISGFIGLSTFYIILYLITFLLFFNIAKKQVGFKIACLLSLFFYTLNSR